VLIRPEILPSGQLVDPSSWGTPALELAPGFKAPLPSSFETLQQYIENSLPAESPVVYGMHPNAELSLLTSLGETLFRTITDVSGGSTGGCTSRVACSAVLSRYAVANAGACNSGFAYKTCGLHLLSDAHCWVKCPACLHVLTWLVVCCIRLSPGMLRCQWWRCIRVCCALRTQGVHGEAA
jgi:hypothetical protein